MRVPSSSRVRAKANITVCPVSVTAMKDLQHRKINEN